MKPIDLADHPGKAYPLVLSLHGSNGRGLTNRGNLESWNRVMAEEEWRRDYPCFVVASQTQFEWFEPGMVPDLTARWFHTNPREMWMDGSASSSTRPSHDHKDARND